MEKTRSRNVIHQSCVVVECAVVFSLTLSGVCARQKERNMQRRKKLMIR